MPEACMKRDPPQLKAVFFDLDDTLVLTGEADLKAYGDVAARAQQRFPQVDVRRLLHAWQLLFVQWPWDVDGKVPVEQWRAALWTQALAEQGIADAPGGAELQAWFREARLHHFRLEPGARELVLALRASGLATAIITNGHPEIQRGKLARCGAGDLFDALLVGGEEAAAGAAGKPDARIFNKAARLVGVQPREAVMIGDSLAADVQGAQNAGLAASVWVNRGGQARPPQAPEPSEEVRHVTELPQALARLQARCALAGVPQAVLAAEGPGVGSEQGSEAVPDDPGDASAATSAEGSRAMHASAGPGAGQAPEAAPDGPLSGAASCVAAAASGPVTSCVT